jgi:hypothetical protein
MRRLTALITAGTLAALGMAHRSSGAIRSTSAAVITPECRKITPT